MEVELTRGRQWETELVICVDSSASVGRRNFELGREFLLRLLNCLELPETRLAVLRFESKMEWVVPGLCGDPGRLRGILRAACSGATDALRREDL